MDKSARKGIGGSGVGAGMSAMDMSVRRRRPRAGVAESKVWNLARGGKAEQDDARDDSLGQLGETRFGRGAASGPREGSEEATFSARASGEAGGGSRPWRPGTSSAGACASADATGGIPPPPGTGGRGAGAWRLRRWARIRGGFRGTAPRRRPRPLSPRPSPTPALATATTSSTPSRARSSGLFGGGLRQERRGSLVIVVVAAARRSSQEEWGAACIGKEEVHDSLRLDDGALNGAWKAPFAFLANLRPVDEIRCGRRRQLLLHVAHAWQGQRVPRHR